METLSYLIDGFASAISPMNLLMCAVGVLLGTAVGVLPGLGPSSAIAILLPVTATLEPMQSIIMLAGIYYGAQYGGSTTSILLNIPGEAASIVTCLDGYPMAKQGRGGPALGIAAIGSFIAGTIGVLGLTFFAPIFARSALAFGPPEYTMLMVMSFSIVMSFAGNSLSKGILIGFLGMLLACVGPGWVSGYLRFCWNVDQLTGGLNLVPIVIGLMAISEVLKGLEEQSVAISTEQVGSVFPSKADLKRSAGPIIRGTFIGFILGLLPGCAPTVSTFLSYDLEKKVSKHPEKFGTGMIEGVASPESANNANGVAGFIPLFSFGIPTSAAMAILLVGLTMFGIQPGPTLFTSGGEFVWTVIASMFIGNLLLIILNLPLVGIWAKITKVPYGILAPVIVSLCVIGSYTIRNSMFDVLITFLFGYIGYVMRKHQWPIVPLIIGFILGPIFERNFITSMSMSNESFLIFIQRPISAGILVLTVVLLILSHFLKKRTASRVKASVDSSMDLPDDVS